MARSLLNTFPLWALALVIVGGSVAVSVAGLVFVRHRFPDLARHKVNDLVGVVIGVLAGVYGIILGFVIVALYEDFQDAQASVQDEAALLIQLYEDTRALPVADAMEREIKSYIAEVRFREWDLMREGESQADVGGVHLPEMYRELQRGMPGATEVQLTFHSDAVDRLNGIVSARLERLKYASESLPGPFAFLLALGAIMLIGLLYTLADTTTKIKPIGVVAAAVLTSSTLLIAIALDHPFSGDISVSNAPLAEDRLGALNVTRANLSAP